jgi:ADP-glucose pyrophosphorylase
MPKPKVLALVLAGGEQYRLQSLNYRLDDGEVLARHRERRAGGTVVTSEVPADEAARQAVVEVAGHGRLSGFHYKPEEPPTTRVPDGATVAPGGRFGGDGPEEASR